MLQSSRSSSYGVPVLSNDDLEELRESATDLSDIDERTKQRASSGFQRAYRLADAVVRGSADPLSA